MSGILLKTLNLQYVEVLIFNQLKSSLLRYFFFRRVHISAATKSYIREGPVKNYVFSPGHGPSRDPALKDMQTYFVTWKNTWLRVSKSVNNIHCIAGLLNRLFLPVLLLLFENTVVQP